MTDQRKSVEEMVRDGEVSLAVVPEPHARFAVGTGTPITWPQVCDRLPAGDLRSWLDQRRGYAGVPDLRLLVALHGLRPLDEAARPALLVWPGPQTLYLNANGPATRANLLDAAAKLLRALQLRGEARPDPVMSTAPAYEFMASQPQRLSRVKYGRDITELSG